MPSDRCADWSREEEATYRALSRLGGALSSGIREPYGELRAKRQRAYNFHGAESTVPWFHDGIKSWTQVAQDLRLSPEDNARYQHVFDDVSNCLREANEDVHIVLLAGSLGKGTGVRNLSDIDVVCIFRNFDPTKYHEYLDSIQEVLMNRQLGTTPTRSSLYPGETATNHAECRHNRTVAAKNAHRGAAYLQFEVEGIKVDILPAAQLGQAMGQTFFNGNVAAFSKMRPIERILWSSSTAPLAVEFVKKQSDLCKDVIRLAKYWRSKVVEQWEKNAYPISFLIELICIHALEETGAATLRHGFMEFLRCIINWTELEVLWQEHYLESDILWQDFNNSDSAPFIIDPTNPTRNLVDRLQNWSPFVSHAHAMLDEMSEMASIVNIEVTNSKQ